MYDYLFLDLDLRDGDPPRAALMRTLQSPAFAALAPAGGVVLGAFVPQLGWRATEAAVLIHWTGSPTDREAALASVLDAGGTLTTRRDRLSPTARPTTPAKPAPDGIYVHRWFAVRADATDEFVSLSTEAWADFEARFQARIYGLFLAEADEDDLRQGVRRMLLLTRYQDHGEWERSRDPSTTAMGLFRRRSELTRNSWGASTLLQPWPPAA